MKIAPPKGTRDFYPEDMALQNRIFAVWRDTARRFGFEEYEGPVFENLELFTRKSGDEIVKQLYNFKDKSDRDIALRPEITPTLARMVAQKGNALKKPVKWFSMPRLFRYERMQRGRLREFFQYNLDIVGEASVAAEAEITAAAVSLLKQLGLSLADFRVRVNSRRLMRAMLLASAIPEARLDAAYTVLDKRAKIPVDALAQAYQQAGFSDMEQQSVESIFMLTTIEAIQGRFGADAEVAAALLELETYFSLMNAYGCAECVVFDPAIVRGLAYYTGIVFEIFDSAKTLRALAGGGRYDGLIALFGGEPTPAVGFGMGDVVVAELLRDKGLVVPYVKPLTAFIVNFSRDSLVPAVQTASLLRAKGVDAEFALKPVGIKRQMEMAQNARYVVFVGGDEWAKGEVKVRDMKTGEERVCAKNAIDLA
ncbi:MAG: histidine--tRNA ligase [Fibrobacterota bacterium]